MQVALNVISTPRFAIRRRSSYVDRINLTGTHLFIQPTETRITIHKSFWSNVRFLSFTYVIHCFRASRCTLYWHFPRPLCQGIVIGVHQSYVSRQESACGLCFGPTMEIMGAIGFPRSEVSRWVLRLYEHTSGESFYLVAQELIDLVGRTLISTGCIT